MIKYKKLFIILFTFVLFVACQVITGNRSVQTAFPSMAGQADEGAFGLYENEELIATTTFHWQADGFYESGTIMAWADQSVYSSIKIKADETGQWTSLQRQDPSGLMTWLNKKGKIQVIRKGKKTISLPLKFGTVLCVRRNPALLSMAIRAYDQAKAGRQTLRLFYEYHNEMIETGITRQDPVERPCKGDRLQLTPYIFEDLDGESTVYADADGRVVLWEIPYDYRTYVRQGYEELFQAKKPEPNISSAQHEVVKENDVMIPIRDGISLATDIYRPKAEGPWPVILLRTPYGKQVYELQARFYARRGYVFSVQDCRGRFSSQGVWEPFVNEARDGYDAIEWLASQPWSTGKVGLIGASYTGIVQWYAAREQPPHLTTIIPNVAMADPYFNAPYAYGCFELPSFFMWAAWLESKSTADISEQQSREIYNTNWGKQVRSLPVIELDKSITSRKIEYWRTWISHPDLDSYWTERGFLNHLEKVRIPVFQQTGWFDGCRIGAKLNYLKM